MEPNEHEVWSKILKNVHFPGDEDLTHLIAVSPSDKRKRIISEYKGTTHESKIAAAIEIQRLWHGYRTRKKLSKILKEVILHSSETTIDSDKTIDDTQFTLPLDKPSWGREETQRVWTRETATVAIQKAWRRYIDMKVFKYFKQLLTFNGKTDPRQMLRSINPTEAQLIDEATGGFIRFRLGGDKFPPLIYYKIFTHRSVVDMCSFSPRDYTAMSEKKPLGGNIHNKEERIATPLIHVNTNSKDGWYQRVENNEWRALTDRSVPIYKLTEAVKKPAVEFHPFRYQRKKEAIATKKRRKVQWMMKMYKEGMKDEMVISAPCVTPSGGIETIVTPHDDSDPALLDDKDIEDLLQWTACLDYDKYLDFWGRLATSYIDHDDN